MKAASIERINDAILFLKSNEIKATQRQVAIQSGLCLRTVKTHWHHRNKNPDVWFTNLFKKISKIKTDRSKYNIAIQQLQKQNDELREQNRQLALRALGMVAI